MWVAVAEQPAFTEIDGVSNKRRVHVKAPRGKLEKPTVGDLSTWSWQESEMSTDFAVKLGFAVGSVSASVQSRTLIAEFSRSTTIEQQGSRHAQYGVAARLIVAVESANAKASLTIPVLAAEGQVGQSRARVSLRVTGYGGNKLAELLPTDILTLNVDTYSTLTTSMNQIVTLIGSDEQNIDPQLLWLEGEDQGPASV